MIYVFVKEIDFTKEMLEGSSAKNTVGEYVVLRFSDASKINSHLGQYKRFDASKYKQALQAILSEQQLFQEKKTFTPTENFAIANNKTVDGKTMYIKVHGQKAVIPAGESHVFEFQIPYEEVYYFGAEIMQNIVGVTDFDVFIPSGIDENGKFTGVVAEQYGFSVNIGELIYIRETPFGARLPQGIVVRSSYTNDTDTEKEIGVNFLMNELKIL